MKVAIVYPIPFGEDGSFGGGERYAWELARTMSEVAETVFVTTGRRRTSRRVGALRVETHPWHALLRGTRINPLVSGFWRSLVDADVIHCLSYNTLLTDLSVLFARLTRKRVFITDVGGGGDLTLARRLDVAALSDGLLLLSRFAGRSFPGRRPSRRVIFGGVDTERFRPAARARERKVVFVGRLLPHKGINYLVEAIGPGLPLVLAGRPYHRQYFEDLQRSAAGKDVTFVTDAADERIIAEHQSSAVAVFPSVSRTMYGTHTDVPELLGLAPLEAMACGTPVICTSVGSLPEVVVDGESGFVVPPGDAVALREKIQLLIGDRDLGRRMGQAARERVLERFTWNHVAERCLAAYAAG
jgi:glycosyltransferase involved in cell wall biosynthesis